MMGKISIYEKFGFLEHYVILNLKISSKILPRWCTEILEDNKTVDCHTL